ncbi:HesA/MoeB/ThiF family protein [Fulvivirga sediminis]|uniref:Molybdopterin-synthase adenylyltransferase n=1 Tax=Fulvivirga sediminis TaxID=2803949 RepID=A0A937F7A1_9BACT|nr:HesA/MoeB/ThiF family protein [Fulvivirga sediminis]MBL3657666.1 HesA/MoeB/ThiF family protein [Fulvivirga sediminis]
MNENISRYSRQIKLPEIGLEGQQKLKNAKVLIVGMGGLGCPAAQYLTAAGVGTLGLLDHDKVDITNLHRQILYTEDNIGQPKAEAAQQYLKKLNSDINFHTYVENLNTENAISIIEKYDIIIDGTDNFQTKYLINDTCLLTNKPWIYASIYKYEGQISVFNYKNGPTYRCLFPKAPKNDISCEETGVIGILPGILGTYQATEAIKLILELGDPLSCKLKIIHTLTMQEQIIKFKRNEAAANTILQKPLKLETVDCQLKDNNTIYLDVREPHEQPQPEHKNILRIPLSQLRDRYREIPTHKPVNVYCQSGIRSKKAIELLNETFDFTNLINVEGGIQKILK